MSKSHGDPASESTKVDLDAHFEKVAATYEELGGDTSKAMCRRMLALCNEFDHHITKNSIVLDNASGPGILTGELIQSLNASDLPTLHCADFSAAMIRVLNKKGWGEKYGVQGSAMDAQELTYLDESFTHSFMNLAIFALPSAEKGAKEIYRTLKPGGISLTSSIRTFGWAPPFQKAQKRVQPDSEPWQGMLGPEWQKKEKIQSVMEAGGFGNVEVLEAAAPLNMAEWGDIHDGISKMATNLITQGWSKEEKAQYLIALEEEMEAEKKSGIPREMGIWVAVAIK